MEAWEECDCGEDGDCRCCHPFDSQDDKGCQLRKDAECRYAANWVNSPELAKLKTLLSGRIRRNRFSDCQRCWHEDGFFLVRDYEHD